MTNAEASHEEESASRQRRYFWLMGIRTACLFLAFFTSGWLRWTFAAGMIVLPWIAVVIANEVKRRREDDSEHMLHAPPADEIGHDTTEASTADDEPDVIIGEVVEVIEPPSSADEQQGRHP